MSDNFARKQLLAADVGAIVSEYLRQKKFIFQPGAGNSFLFNLATKNISGEVHVYYSEVFVNILFVLPVVVAAGRELRILELLNAESSRLPFGSFELKSQRISYKSGLIIQNTGLTPTMMEDLFEYSVAAVDLLGLKIVKRVLAENESSDGGVSPA